MSERCTLNEITTDRPTFTRFLILASSQAGNMMVEQHADNDRVGDVHVIRRIHLRRSYLLTHLALSSSSSTSLIASRAQHAAKDVTGSGQKSGSDRDKRRFGR